MIAWRKHRLFVAIGIGLAGGLILAGVWPQTPLHATATDRSETFAIATGEVDYDMEAVYFLDFLTGELRAVVLGRMGNGFTGLFGINVATDLGIDPQKNSKYLMVTGKANMRQAGGSRMRPSGSVCYVAEVSSGKMGAYAIPWSTSMQAAGQTNIQPLVRIAATYFRNVTGSTPAATSTPAPRPRKAP
jgi:hypothetical protein